MTKSQHMLQALALAKKSLGKTTPNPMVGCVIVRDGKVIGKGWHHKAGEAHAEVNAIRDCIENTAGSDAYVTLEPCSTHGRTPPCCSALIDAGIKKVYIGCLDPNPGHAGRAIEILQEAGIEVEHGIEEKKCFELNLPFFTWIRTGRPMVSLKMATTLDGKIATADGHSQWITGPDAREEVQKLRKRCDAIMVGGETVRKDNPSLTVREDNWPTQPERFIWSRSNNFPSDIKVFNLPDGKGATVVAPNTPDTWNNFLTELGKNHITNLLLEGGGQLAAAALENAIVDEIFFYIAPKILGGANSRPSVAGKDPQSLNEAFDLIEPSMKQVGSDFLIHGYLKNPADLKK